jgi:hypothetical protein
LDEQPRVSTEETRYKGLIHRLDFEDALDGGATARGNVHPIPTSLVGPSDAETAQDLGEPCAVYPVSWEGATALPTKFGVEAAADSFQGAMALDLATAVNPRFSGVGSQKPDLVIRSRIVRADPGNQFLRWALPFLAGAAVFEVDVELLDKGALLAQIHATCQRRWGFSFGGYSQDLLADAAKLAGERAAKYVLAALAAQRIAS